MRLINVHTGKLEEHMVAPPYAILSHTWRDSEISFQDMTTCADVQSRPEYDKIRDSGREAVRYNLEYVWIDTCCIDKSSSAELSEAINSMFRWYRDAALCFAYLEDLPIGQGAATKLELERCRWFTRGWTLQELIAPAAVRFYDRGWNDRGTSGRNRGGCPGLWRGCFGNCVRLWRRAGCHRCSTAGGAPRPGRWRQDQSGTTHVTVPQESPLDLPRRMAQCNVPRTGFRTHTISANWLVGSVDFLTKMC